MSACWVLWQQRYRDPHEVDDLDVDVDLDPAELSYRDLDEALEQRRSDVDVDNELDLDL